MTIPFRAAGASVDSRVFYHPSFFLARFPSPYAEEIQSGGPAVRRAAIQLHDLSVHMRLNVSFWMKTFDIAVLFMYDESGLISHFRKITIRGDTVAQADTHFIPNNYTPVGDMIVVAICFVMLSLIFFSYMRKSPAFRVFMTIIFTLILTAVLDVTFNALAYRLGAVPVVYAFRCLFHAALFTVFFLFTLYITEVTRLDRKKALRVLWCAFAVLVTFIAVDVASSVRSLTEEHSAIELGTRGHLVFVIGYVAFAVTNLILLATVRHRLYKWVMFGFYASVALAFAVMLLQRVFGGGSSFTVATFLFPVIAMFYIMHSTPYDVEIGALDNATLAETVREWHEKKKDFIFMSLFLPDLSGEGRQLPDAIRAVVRKLSVEYFRGALLFQPESGHLLLLFRKNKNPDFEHRIEEILQAFKFYHRAYRYDYRIVIGEAIEAISRKNEYVSFIRNIHRSMPVNTIHRISPEDTVSFDRSEYILRQLADIHSRHDLNDKRVLVYCQPVFNVATGKYDTAEALMRLRLDELGLVFPDQFIFLAEENGYIHTLTEIILHKTCREIRKLTAEGYEISRISINVSVLELKADNFCGDISRIISGSGIPGEKVAIELTESQNESEFDVMKSKIFELKDKGIKFYLDDFGTGYSNMERIIELPFDIIKFDRSLVIASGNNARSEKIVHNMADLFNDLNYSVLYEGVENESDETLCREMCASYLQGYKFSRPIPIEDLRRFAERKKEIS